MWYKEKDLPVKIKNTSEDLSMKKEAIDTNSLAHTKWNCKYHIVFASKYRRKVFFGEKRLEIREITLCYPLFAVFACEIRTCNVTNTTSIIVPTVIKPAA